MRIISKLSLLSLAGLGLSLLGTTANAQQLNGSLPFALFGNTLVGGTDLSNSTSITTSFAITSGVGTGSYSPIPTGTTYATTALTFANPDTFTITNATYGAFTGSTFTVVTSTANNYDVELFGTYTPGPGLQPFSPTNGELRLSFTQTGASVSGSGTLSTPAFDTPPVPEPGSVALLVGMGVTGAGFLTRRRMARKSA